MTKISPIGAAVAAELRAERAAQAMSVADMYAAAGVAASSGENWLNGKTEMRIGILQAFADVLGVTVSELVIRAEQRVARMGEMTGEVIEFRRPSSTGQ